MFFNNKLTLNYLKVYGCKAFIFIVNTLVRKNRFNRLLLRAWISYLVGYILINQFRIWLLIINKVIIIKDVYFNKECIFDGKLKTL